MAPGATKLSIKTLSKMGLISTLIINSYRLHVILRCYIFHCYAECRYAERRFAECRGAQHLTEIQLSDLSCFL
jgi:hypothetical protein